MSKYKLEFKLKQHTPIIHFQHDQEGATLRASELKPKLDRFILKKIGDGDYEKGKKIALQNKWLIGNGQHPALDYMVKLFSDSISMKIDLQDTNKDETPKVKFNNETNRREIATKPFPMFFATMGEEWKKNQKMFSFNENIEILFNCLKSDLLKEINNSFPLFLLLTNFGTRQNKGFGSYYISENDKSYKTPNDVIKDCDIVFWEFRFSLRKERDVSVVDSYVEYQRFYKVFDKINDFYKAIRSGINLSFLKPPFYLKSLLYIYATQKRGVTWAKKEIKDFHFSSFITEHNHIHPNSIAISYLYRDLLGLSTVQEWVKPYNDTITKEDLQRDSNDNTINGGKIDRYKSPITFVPIQNSDNEDEYVVYVWAKDIDSGMLDRKFKVNSKNISGQEIATPNSFDIADYMDFLTNIDLKSVVDQTMHNHWYFRKLTPLFNSFRKTRKS